MPEIHFSNISLDKLLPQEEALKLRPVVQDEAFTQLVSSIRTTGILVPFMVMPVTSPRGSYTVLGGNRRLEAAKLAFKDAKEPNPTVPCEVLPGGLEAVDQIALSAMDNLHRQQLKPSELYALTKTLKKMGITTQSKQAKLLNVSEPYLSQIIAAGRVGRIQTGGPVKPRPSTSKASKEETFDCPKCHVKITRAWDEEAGTYIYQPTHERNASKA